MNRKNVKCSEIVAFDSLNMDTNALSEIKTCDYFWERERESDREQMSEGERVRDRERRKEKWLQRQITSSVQRNTVHISRLT